MLKITNPNAGTEATESSDVVGRLRSGYQINGEPASLANFRVTTGDQAVLDAIIEAFGVDTTKPNGGTGEWEATGEDYLEVFTTTSSVNIILASANDYKASLTRRTRDGEFMYATDGEVITAVGEDYEDEYEVGDKDPQDGQDLETRKAKAKKGLGSSPDIRVRFQIEGFEQLGTFEFRTGGWSLVHNDPEPKLRSLPDGPIKAVLKLTTVEGKKFTWTKPELLVRGTAVPGAKTKAKPVVSDETPF